MPVIQKIIETRRKRKGCRLVFDDATTFDCHVNVAAKLGLRSGAIISADQIDDIRRAQRRQECFDQAMRYRQTRMHSHRELELKLRRRGYESPVVDDVLKQLVAMRYVDDAMLAADKVASSQRRLQGRVGVSHDLERAGVDDDVAGQAIEAAVTPASERDLATQLAQKHLPRLARLDKMVARRRLIGLLARRGFGQETIQDVVDTILGAVEDEG